MLCYCCTDLGVSQVPLRLLLELINACHQCEFLLILMRSLHPPFKFVF